MERIKGWAIGRLRSVLMDEYAVVLKVSQEDVLGILMKMDQYLFGKM